MSDAVGTLLLSIREMKSLKNYSGLEEIVEKLFIKFTERQSLKTSLLGRYALGFKINFPSNC